MSELNPEKLERLNSLLADPKLVLPEHRRSVHRTGSNLMWLRQHIKDRNPVVPDELLRLLGINEPS